MIEPVALKDFFITFFSSALIILAGAGYALCYAWSKVNTKTGIKITAYSCFIVLMVSVFVLTRAANFSSYWLSLSMVMVLGYFFAPIAIWQLCQKTHIGHDLIMQTKSEDKP
jgi:Zn-dependent protease with chaperone function